MPQIPWLSALMGIAGGVFVVVALVRGIRARRALRRLREPRR